MVSLYSVDYIIKLGIYAHNFKVWTSYLLPEMKYVL
jgi:hypothetical protein